MERETSFIELDSGQWKLVQRVIAGEDVVLTRDGRRVARIVPVSAEESVLPRPPRQPRSPGVLKHLNIGPEPEGFFDPLSDEELAEWHRDPEPAP